MRHQSLCSSDFFLFMVYPVYPDRYKFCIFPASSFGFLTVACRFDGSMEILNIHFPYPPSANNREHLRLESGQLYMGIKNIIAAASRAMAVNATPVVVRGFSLGNPTGNSAQTAIDAFLRDQAVFIIFNPKPVIVWSIIALSEICNNLSIGASNARVLLHRARTRLFKMVDHYQETGEC